MSGEVDVVDVLDTHLPSVSPDGRATFGFAGLHRNRRERSCASVIAAGLGPRVR